MMPIVALGENTIKEITTTQIITCVQSAVKELVENALDAEANSIEVYMEDKGLSCIEVRDNGKGISKLDSAYMALPYYTSKILNTFDLESLETYGFRGEALNALCRVSNVKVITRTFKDTNARCYSLSCEGKVDKAEYCSRAFGTTIQARSLFKNFPVRRQIISDKKYANRDIKSIENLLRGFAICHPELQIRYCVDGSVVFSKIPAASYEENLINIFGKKFVNLYDTLDFSDSHVTIKFTIPKKELSDLLDVNQINYQYIFVNNRPVTMKEFDKTVVKLLSDHFGEKISGRKKPVFFLIITVPPNAVDVNLEANKTIVLLVNQSSLMSIVSDLLINYYGITAQKEPEKSQKAIPSSSPTYHDSSYENVEPPAAKKPRIENSTFISHYDDKKNVIMTDSVQPEKVSAIKTEPTTQIPEDNNAVVSSNPQQAQKLPVDVTQSQWSKGQVPITLAGRTDVTFLGSNEDFPDLTKINASTNPEANKNGFLKFSREMTPKLVHQKPEMTPLQIAKILSNEWKQLGSVCRKKYRQFGLQDKSVSNTKTTASAPKIPKSLVKDATENEKRLLNMIENMKGQKPSDESAKVPSKTLIPWNINMQSLLQSFHNQNYQTKSNNLIVGPVGNQIWITNINMKLWCLDVKQLFQGLEENECEKEPELVEGYFQRWRTGHDSMDLMQPLYQLNSIIRKNK